VVVVLPAYNAALTLEKTYREIPMDIVDEVVLVDDVVTTGSTINECAGTLRCAGATAVDVLAVAMARP